VLTFLAATLGVMSVLMLGLHGGPRVTHTITLYAFIGYCLLVFAGMRSRRSTHPGPTHVSQPSEDAVPRIGQASRCPPG
jgi:hypothetical protein